ncbi:MAG: hypothetical protein ACHQRJ_13360 [Alphaproteobacteria bacterium]
MKRMGALLTLAGGLFAVVLSWPAPGLTQTTDAGFRQCAGMPDDTRRLGCYDRLARERDKERPPTGTIKLCRRPGVTGIHQEDAIDIPAGATIVGPLSDDGEPPASGPHRAEFFGTVTLATTTSALLPHGVDCVTIAARIKNNPHHGTVKASDYFIYGASGGGMSPRDQWASLADYRIIVIEDFK